MAVTKVDPTPFEQASSIVIDSDAETNELALREIENWAHSHGFVRTNEYYLRQILVNGNRQFRGVCYRIANEERRAIDAELLEVQQRAERLGRRRSA